MRMPRRCCRKPLLGIILLLASGCASVDQDAGHGAVAPHAATVGQRPDVRLVLDDDFSASFEEVAEQSAQASALFGNVVAARQPAPGADMTIELRIKSQRRPLSDTENVWHMTTVLLLTVYPSSCARDEYELVADVTDRAGRRLKSYDLRDSDTSWMWLFHGENCGDAATPARVKEAVKGLLAKLFQDIEGDRLTTIANTGGEAGNSVPLIYVTADRARDIVQRAALTAPPFARFTFDENQARSADYTLQVQFESGASEQTLSRTIGAIWTIGLFSACSPTVFKLGAKLLDRSGRQVHAYALSDTYRSRFRNGCFAVDESNDPEDVAELVGRLFAEMSRERDFAVTP
jgi:hypothetical protein